MASKPKTHKSTKGYRDTNDFAWCGQPADAQNLRRFWKQVTCKNCLKLRPQ